MDMMAVFQGWDGKTTARLAEIVAHLRPQDYPVLCDACRSSDDKIARAASWVLKVAYENGMSDIPYPAELLQNELHWEVALHLLQSVRYARAEIPAETVSQYLTHQMPMVRAWALDAYVAINPADAETKLANAAADPAASVRARARNLAK